GIRPDVAVSPDGAAFVADRSGSMVRILKVDQAGRPHPAVAVAPGLLGEVRTAGSRAVVNVLPEDAWRSVGEPYGFGGHATVGMPIAGGGHLLRVAGEDRVRLGMVDRDGAVTGAVELRSRLRFGDLALAEPDGHGGYVVVVHVWQVEPAPAD